MRKAIVVSSAAAALAVLLTAGVAASRQLTLLVINVPDRQATLLVKRSEALDMSLLESETSLCRRQGPGSPLHSVMLPPAFCPLALAASREVQGERVLLSLPYMPWLHRLAS
ncbi:MAG: hypothetical protein QHC78_12975 [Pigmentiphaga sp.]|uniref:hypothetical protein n=1 Tax=Pigmentiphaga sp. TaxID=1977564 RepID=UPI0029BA9A10|nr:hypothetical protein [Pigmentiphaga sp.]MDX3906593.1 hypothetical protein [Pigmentiphaga sp.]